MDTRRVGRMIRAVRVHLGQRQSDIAAAAGVSQRTISAIESGSDEVALETVERVAAVVNVALRLESWWRNGDVERLLDRDHAAIVEHVVRELDGDGWQTRVEYTFNRLGERGSVDILAWHPGERTLLIIEVKSKLWDLQELFAAYGRKVRIVPELARSEGWSAKHVGRVLVVLGTTANRNVVVRHARTFDSTFPDRTPEIRRWLQRPDRHLGGVWFISTGALAGAEVATGRRVRVRPRSSHAVRARSSRASGRAPLRGP